MEKQFTEDDLISFGKYLLSKDRLQRIKDHVQNEVISMEIFHSITDAAFCNWKRERFGIESEIFSVSDWHCEICEMPGGQHRHGCPYDIDPRKNLLNEGFD